MSIPIGVAIILLLLQNVLAQDPICPNNEMVIVKKLHYPNLDSCEDATIQAESTLDICRYRSACQAKYGFAELPESVSAAEVIDCFTAPAPGWSRGTIVEVKACCSFPCDPSAWTPWYDRDDPTGTGDFEPIHEFLPEGKACPNPCGI